MKFRKITSLLIASMMAFSAFSALTYAADPAPKATVTVTQWDTADAEEYWGEALEDGYGLFKIVIGLSDLGTISNKKTAGKINGTLLTSVYTELHAQNISLCEKESVLGSMSQSGDAKDFDGIIAMYFETSLDAYPVNTGSVVNDDNHSVDKAMTLDVYGPIGSTIKFEKSAIGTQSVVKGAFDGPITYTDFSIDDITLGSVTPPPPEEKELGLEITDASKGENGYVWTVKLTQKNGAAADTLTATLQSGEETGVKHASNVADFFGGNGALEFGVGVKTVRTIDKLTLDVADSTEAGVTATATWTAE